MIEQEPPRTRLEQLLRQQHVTLEEFRKNYQRAAKTELSERQAYRWVAGELSTQPYPAARGTLEKMFGEPVARLFGPPYGIEALRPDRRQGGSAPGRGTARTDWEGQVIAMSADRARDFLSRIEASNVGAETLDQLADDVRRLVITSQQPLPSYLGDLVATQDRAFTLLEGHQRPEQTRDLYLLAGITCGLMAYASHDLGTLHDAMTQARAGYACADNAGHDGLRAWTRGIQSLITYYSGRLEDSVRYAQSSAEAATRSRGTAGIWLASSEARALAAVNRLDEAYSALARGTDARDRAEPDGWTVSVDFAPSAGPASSVMPPLPSPGVERPKRTTPSDSPSTPLTPTPQPQTRTAISPTCRPPAECWPCPGCIKDRLTARQKRWHQCSIYPPPNASTGS